MKYLSLKNDFYRLTIVCKTIYVFSVGVYIIFPNCFFLIISKIFY